MRDNSSLTLVKDSHIWLKHSKMLCSGIYCLFLFIRTISFQKQAPTKVFPIVVTWAAILNPHVDTRPQQRHITGQQSIPPISMGKIWTPDTSPSTHSISTNSMAYTRGAYIRGGLYSAVYGISFYFNINIATFVGFQIAVYAYVVLRNFTYTSPSSPS